MYFLIILFLFSLHILFISIIFFILNLKKPMYHTRLTCVIKKTALMSLHLRLSYFKSLCTIQVAGFVGSQQAEPKYPPLVVNMVKTQVQ